MLTTWLYGNGKGKLICILKTSENSINLDFQTKKLKISVKLCVLNHILLTASSYFFVIATGQSASFEPALCAVTKKV